MTPSKPTPGPWKRTGDKETGCGIVSDSGGPFIIAEVSQLQMGYEGNARLIAAAPCLLEALQRLLSEAEGRTTDDMVRRTSPAEDARAALKKARGET